MYTKAVDKAVSPTEEYDAHKHLSPGTASAADRKVADLTAVRKAGRKLGKSFLPITSDQADAVRPLLLPVIATAEAVHDVD